MVLPRGLRRQLLGLCWRRGASDRWLLVGAAGLLRRATLVSTAALVRLSWVLQRAGLLCRHRLLLLLKLRVQRLGYLWRLLELRRMRRGVCRAHRR